MSQLLSLAWKSLVARRATALLTLAAVALSTALFVGVERMRSAAHDSFLSTVSGVDVVVGGRTGPINLLLYSVFRIGNATSPVSWETYEGIANRPDVAWAVPVSLGDSHRGYRVMGTTSDYFTHFAYGQKQKLELDAGVVFDDHAIEAVLGSEVARTLGYALGDRIILSHGVGDVSFHQHDDFKFEIVGILAPTGTPVDQTVHISLDGMEAIHAPPAPKDDDAEHDHGDHVEHAHHDDEALEHHDDHADHEGHESHDEDAHDEHDHAHEAHDDHGSHEDHEGEHDHQHLDPEKITAIFVGMKAPAAALSFRYQVNSYTGEPLLAILPGETISELWSVVGSAEKVLRAISIFVMLTGLATILIAILTSLNERRREMAILRAVGAGAGHIFGLIMLEAVMIAFLGAAAGIALVHGAMAIAAPLIQRTYGLAISTFGIGWIELAVLAGAPLAAGIMSLWPAAKALKNALSDGLTIRI